MYAFPTNCYDGCPPISTGTTGSGGSSAPAISDGTVYIGSDDFSLYAFDLSGAPPSAARPDIHMLHPDLRLRVSG